MSKNEEITFFTLLKKLFWLWKHFCKKFWLPFHTHSVALIWKGYLNYPFILKYIARQFSLALFSLEEVGGIWRISGSCFAKHKLVLSKHPPSRAPNDQILLVRLPCGGNHTTDCCAALRQFCLSSPATVKKDCWLVSTFCSHSQMSIREILETEGLYVCREQGQFSVAAVSGWHRLILTQPTFLLQNHKVKAPGALLPFSIRYEFSPSLY